MVMRPLVGLIASLALIGLARPACVHAQPAQDWAGAAFGPQIRGPTFGGTISADDLTRLRVFGALSVSPDGRWLTFMVYQAVPETNTYVARWFVQPSDGSRPPVPFAQDGGQPIPHYSYGLPQAYIGPERAKWSADSGQVAFRRMDGKRIELWVADRATLTARRVDDGESQVTAFAWTPLGDLVIRHGLNFAVYEQNLAAEAKNGWLQDERTPLASRGRPTMPDCDTDTSDPACDRSVTVVASDGKTRLATPEEIDALTADVDEATLKRAPRSDGVLALTELVDPAYPNAGRPLRRVSTTLVGAGQCPHRACIGAGFRALGWAQEGQSIWFLKAESGIGRLDGAPSDFFGLYEWSLRRNRVRAVVRGEGTLEDCHLRQRTFYCMMETVGMPRSVVSFGVDGGAPVPMADANPMIRTKALPRVIKLPLADFKGDPAYAHVVLPNNYAPGRRYPLVITQYRSRGFLRGQVGNEIPIYPLAAAGFVVASLDRPEDYDAMAKLDFPTINRLGYMDDLRDRRSVFSVVGQLVDKLVNDGLVDRKKMAITGLSAGAENVHYELQHTDMFAAAIASSGAHDRTFLAVVPEGAGRTKLMTMLGVTQLVPDLDSALGRLSWSSQPEKLRTPLLINVGEYETPLGAEGLEALKHAQRPLEVRVFPDEMHVKYHPQAIAGVYENNMLWLKYWLLGEKDPRQGLKGQYARWDAMRDRLASEALAQ